MVCPLMTVTVVAAHGAGAGAALGSTSMEAHLALSTLKLRAAPRTGEQHRYSDARAYGRSEARPGWMLRLRHRAKPSPAVAIEATPDWRLPPELVAASLEECLPALSSALDAAPTQPQNTTRRYVVLHMLCCRLSCQILERVVRARQQLGGAHRIVWSQFEELRAEDTNLWLLRALFRERVDLLTTRDLAESFGGATFAKPGRIHTMWDDAITGLWSPHWVFCDWAYIAWFHRMGHRAMVQGTQGVWVMTYEVARGCSDH